MVQAASLLHLLNLLECAVILNEASNELSLSFLKRGPLGLALLQLVQIYNLILWSAFQLILNNFCLGLNLLLQNFLVLLLPRIEFHIVAIRI